jgi:UDP-N-acetylmuramate dehydrogenase
LYRQQGLKQLFESICPGRVKQGELIGPYTTLRIGGKADWFIQPKDSSELKQLLEVGRSRNIPWFVLGRGSNLLVSDRGVRGLVIHVTSPRQGIKIKPLKNTKVLLEVEAGVPLSRLVRWGLKNHFKGLEFLAGIPGSVGGAWAMNAGSYGKEIKELTFYLKVFTPGGGVVRKGKGHLLFSYRNLNLSPGEIILSGGLKVSLGETEDVQQETRRLWSQRRSTQPLDRASCGSVFKNPPGAFAGELIEDRKSVV